MKVGEWRDDRRWSWTYVNRKQDSGLRLVGPQWCVYCRSSIKARGFNRHVRRLHFEPLQRP